MTDFILSWLPLALALAATVAAVCAAHIPGLRDWTGAAPLEPEREPYTAVTETDESFLAGDFPAAPTPRVADRPSQMPHPTQGAPVIPTPNQIALRLQLRRATDRIAQLEQQLTQLERQFAQQRRGETARVSALEDRLAHLQTANEGHYRQQYDATGGPSFDPAQPFGQAAGADFTRAAPLSESPLAS